MNTVKSIFIGRLGHASATPKLHDWQTSCHRKVSLRSADLHYSPPTPACLVEPPVFLTRRPGRTGRSNQLIKFPNIKTLWMVGDEGLGHDKISLKFFATPPQSVAFAIRLPALRSADLHCSSPPSSLSQTSLIKRVEALFLNLVGDEGLEPPTSSLSVTRSNQLS